MRKGCLKLLKSHGVGKKFKGFPLNPTYPQKRKVYHHTYKKFSEKHKPNIYSGTTDTACQLLLYVHQKASSTPLSPSWSWLWTRGSHSLWSWTVVAVVFALRHCCSCSKCLWEGGGSAEPGKR